tara:strand:- start:45 stop:701 length:657 start_codon:yes stop_codon:yes gene_type:complete
MNKIRILIVDDHTLIINGIKSLLSPLVEFDIVGEAHDGLEAIAKASELKPDVIIMDISMPIMNGIEACREILSKLPDIKILALTQHENTEYVLKFLEAGGCGYLLKNSKKEEFVEAINESMKGRKYFTKSISNLLLNNLLNEEENIKEEESKISLTKREIEIIKLIAEELNNSQIAEQLNISLRTVETHRRNIMQKLKVKNIVSLIKYAVANNLIELN